MTVGGCHTSTEQPQVNREFDAFYLAEWDRLVRRVGLVVTSAPHAEDVVQEVMAEVYRRWDTIRDPAAYAFRASVNGAVRAARRVGRELPRSDRQPDTVGVEDPATVEAEHLRTVLLVLSPRQRAMVVLKYYDGYLEREIAEIVGCRPGSVGPTITRALRRLRFEVTR